MAMRAGVESLSESSDNAVNGKSTQQQTAAPGVINNRDNVIRALERIS
ncbi:MAG: hypothetical protein KZQ60_03080 [Candidatus Thiodiazotropha sp. (ex Lucinoma aequizonata)]|nr:hypothetical protein [Candidatus Thiodiazotropha sp. (ex Lucinoma aequizonata)]MCU7895314.1 hypothetical protein [Candidatus Thiodiazotropha sp. (ex Lucinoma aequizonata)]MCU7909421.1 hypothetical protein [Candidatus Thiodiazotropha sp. (ex Lucinoma aequizonata)]MCU7912236.1 hypothetical protein [Candidatus Thiodiazotropha sp. (ex Lucinoma aequizonata)]